VVALLAGVLWLYMRPGSRAPRRYLLIVGITYALTGTSAVTHSATRLLSRQFQPFTLSDAPAGRRVIVVLGSGSYLARDWENATLPLLDRASAERVIEAVRIYRLTNAEWIISSAGMLAPSESAEPNGQTMGDGLVRLGVPAARVLVETESRTTRDQAAIVRRMLSQLGVDRPILVTSALHMRRALASFRAAGLNPVPAIARDPFHPPHWLRRWVPTDEGFGEGALVAHEAIGLGYYWLRGWARF
jgi:uncharacterized SAM-binding protein YcdF (DUF218 family)